MLKHLTGLSDRNLVNTWAKRADWQYFTGMKQFEQEALFDQSNLCRWRKKLGVAGASKILAELIKVGIQTGLIDKKLFERINVDTTVQEKNIRYPTDARSCDRARAKLVKICHEEGIKLRQSYTKVGKREIEKAFRLLQSKSVKAGS